MLTTLTRIYIVSATLSAVILPCLGQISVAPDRLTGLRPFAANVIVPQSASWRSAAIPGRPSREGAVQVTGVTVDVTVTEQVATTTMDVHLPGRRSRPSGLAG